ncbi:MAG: tRNA (adenosine(37)-N6)-threonylcarbamoyltransferase complex dimerization subunit type 1 TsaB [Candidatus Tyrphobacter sp.]
MNVLALEGALGTFSIAVARDGSVVAEVVEDGKRALENGLAAVAAAMGEAGIDRAGLDRLGVGCGPGSFTGLRIALSYAKALALAWRLPLVTLTSYDLLRGDAEPPVLTVVRGRPGIVCAEFASRASSSTACGDARSVLAKLLRDPTACTRAMTVTGNAEDVRGALAERGIVVTEIAPPPVPASILALLSLRAQPLRSPHEARPEYGELPAAKIPRSLLGGT